MARFRKVATAFLLIMSVSPTLADEGASGLYVPGNFGFGAGVTPDPGLYLSSGVGYYDGAIKVYIEGGKILLDVEKRPFSAAFAALWVPETKILGGRIGLSLGSSYSFAWAHGVVTGLIDAEKTVEGWGLGDTIPRAQIGWTSGAWSNTFYLTCERPWAMLFITWYCGRPPRKEFSNQLMMRLPALVRAMRPAPSESKISSSTARQVSPRMPITAAAVSKLEMGFAT